MRLVTSWPDRTVRLTTNRLQLVVHPFRTADSNRRVGLVLDANRPWRLTADANTGSP